MKKYRVKFDSGRVLGPFSIDEFKELLAKGHIKGDEECQLFPAGNWLSISLFEELKTLINDTSPKEKSDEATFIRKLSDIKRDKDLGPVGPQKIESSTDVANSEFPQAFEFQKEIPKVAAEEEEYNLTETEINDPIQDNRDKTLINPETLQYLEELRKEKEKQKIIEDEKAKRVEIKEPEVDLINDSTQFVDTRNLKHKLREEIQATENQIAKEIEEKKKAELNKELEAQKRLQSQHEEEDEDEEPESKFKKLIVLGAILILGYVLLFPEEPKKVVKPIVPIEPIISFPQRFETPSEELADQNYKQGMLEYQKHTYAGYLNAIKYFRISSENKFKDNQATYRLIYLYSELLNNISDKIIRTDNANTTFKLLQIFMTKINSEAIMASAAANFYYYLGKYDAAVQVVDKFLTIKTNKPSMELFAIYLKSLLKSGDLERAKKVFEKLETVENKPYEVDFQIMEYLFSVQRNEEAIVLLEEMDTKYPKNVKILLAKAKQYLVTGDLGSLEILLNQVRDLEAENSPVYFAKYLEYQGMLAVSKNNNDKALEYFKKSLNLFENQELRGRLAGLEESQNQEANLLITESKAINYINLAKEHLKNKNMNLAFKAALDAEEVAPHYIPAKLFLADLQVKKSFYNDALKILEDLYKEHGNNYDVAYSLMMLYADAYKFRDLDRMIENLVNTDFRNDPRFLKVQAKKYLQKENFSLAVQWLQKALNLNPLDDDLIFEMASLYIKYKKFDDGKILLRRAMELDPSRPEYDIKYAEIVYEIDGAEAAIGYLYNILRENPNNVSALSAIGIYYFNSGQMKFFEETKKKMEELAKRDKALYEFLIKAAKRNDKPNDVIKYSNELLSVDPGDLGARMYLGQVYVEQEKFKEGLEQFREVESRLDTYPLVKYNISKLYMLIDNTEKATEYAQAEIDANPTNVHGYILLGDIFSKKKDWAQAEANYKKAQKINSSDVDALIGLATLNFMKSQFTIALDLYSRAKKIEPERAETYKLLGDVYRKIGQSSQAVEQYKTFLELSPNSRYRENLSDYIKVME